MLKYFNIESVKIACWVNSSDFGAHKQSLVFIHGSGSDHSAWSRQYARLHQRYNVVAVDLPGHGHSGGRGEADIAGYVLWIKKLLEDLALPRPVLAGHSLGAAIALRFALKYPQAITGIVCVGGGMKMPVNPFFLEFLQTNPAEVPAEVIDLIYKYSVAKANRALFYTPLQKSLSQTNVDVLYGDLAACNELDLTREADKINVPALITCGAEDKMTLPDLARQLAASISGARLVIVEGAGHMVMLEKPVEFNESLEKFVTSIPDRA